MSRTDHFPVSGRSTLRRHPERGSARRDEIFAILQEGYVCHIGWGTEGGSIVIPMAYGLWGEEIVLHGSKGSRLLNALSGGERVTVAVTLLDGLVLARSAFFSTMNYRSVVLFGRCRVIEDADEKKRALDAFVDHVVPGRSAVTRPMTEEEVESTAVLALHIEEATAKTRQGPPKEPERDRHAAVWAGVVPLDLRVGEPEGAPDLESPHRPPGPVTRRHGAIFSSGVAEPRLDVGDPSTGRRS